MMLGLKNCPFCGGSTFTRYTKVTHHLNSVVTWHHIRCDAPACCGEMRHPSEEGVIAAWNRRAIQAVGPEPAVAVRPLEWDDDRYVKTFGMVWSVHRAFGMWYWHGPDGADDQAFETIEAAKAAAEADYASRIRSALVAAPPAEPVVEAPQPANSVRKAAERVVWFDWSSNDPDAVAAVDALRAALAAKPAVKDDETVVEARKRLERAGGAMSNILYNLKQDPTFAEALRDRIAECQEACAKAFRAASNRAEAAEAREARLSEALRPFALISSEGVVKAAQGHVTITTSAEYFHRARAALSGSGSGWREPEPIKEVKALRQALLECRERAETGGRRIETAMDACEDISEIATCALPPEGWQGPAAPQQGGE